MIAWEYKVVETTYKNYDNIVDNLNEEGEQGWELINERLNSREGVTAYTFKRRKRIETRWPMRFDDGGFLEKDRAGDENCGNCCVCLGGCRVAHDNGHRPAVCNHLLVE